MRASIAVAAQLELVLAQRQRLARGHAQLQLDKVEAGDRLGHRVLDLEARVHLEEEERDETSSAAAMNSTVPAFV